MSIASAAVLLFLVFDPLGNIPFYLSALKGVAPERVRVVMVRELLIALAILVAFLFLGQRILAVLGISGPALTASGGVVLFLIALRMIFPSHDTNMQEQVDGEPFVVPLAVPYVAGPSALATVILLMSRDPARWLDWLIALLSAWGATAVILFAATSLRRYLGGRGLVATERLMGMVLIAVATQMLMDGVRQFLDAGT